MKKYILLGFLFLAPLGFIFFEAYKWIEASKHREYLQKVIELTYALKTQSQQHELFIHTSNDTINFDNFTESSKKLTKDTKELVNLLKSIDDEIIEQLSIKISKKSEIRSYLYEDTKSFNAVIKNSISWLKEAKREELLKEKELINYALVTYVSDILVAYYEGGIESFQPFMKMTQLNPLLMQHINIIYTYYAKITELNQELNLSNINENLTDTIDFLQKQVVKQEEIISDLIVILLMSSLLFLSIGVITNIRELKSHHVAEKLKQELQQFVDALNASAIVSKTNPKGIITYVNDNFCDVSGYTREELLHKNHNIIRHPDMPKEVFKELWKTIRNKKIFKGTIKNRAKNGSEYFVDSTVIPFVGLDNEIVEYMAVRYNVTELIYTRDKGLEAQKAKDGFLANMSHELRTPLNSIIGFSQILQRLIQDEKQKKYLDNMLKSSKHLLDLINDILDLSKIQSSNFTLNIHSFNIYKELNSFISQFDTQASNAHIDLKREFEKSLQCNVNGDWLRISQIISNLLSNAIKFTPAGGVVTIYASYKDENFVMTIKDTGIGMEEESLQRIFKPFEQADSSTTRKYGGTGLGLSIVSALTGMMHAKLETYSTKDVGSTFVVTIPLVMIKIDEEAQVQADINEEKGNLHLKGNILVAEDNRTNQMLIQVLLENFGLTCDIANDGIEAVEIFGKKKYDLVLMDESMPNLTGVEAMKQIRAKYNTTVPIIALTANVMEGDRERFLSEGMDGFISKPVDYQGLYTALKSYLSLPASAK